MLTLLEAYTSLKEWENNVACYKLNNRCLTLSIAEIPLLLQEIFTFIRIWIKKLL